MVPPGARGILTASILLPILAIFTVALRILARKKKAVALQSDDWTIIVNLVIHTFYIHSIANANFSLEGSCGEHRHWNHLRFLHWSSWHQLRPRIS